MATNEKHFPEEKQSKNNELTHVVLQQSSLTNFSVGNKINTRPTPLQIPDSEVFDLESIFVVDSPEKVKGGRGRGVSEAKTEPPLFCYFEPPTSNEPELNFNQISIFKSWKELDALNCIDSDTIRSILVRPLQDFRPFDEMKMMTSSGDPVPCHLPLFGDLYGMSEVLFVLLGWEMDMLRKTKSNKILPETLRSVIDPRPVLMLDGPVHDFSLEPVRIAMGCYTDAVHVMKLTTTETVFTVRVLRTSVFLGRKDGDLRPRRWYHETVFKPHTIANSADTMPVELDSTFVVWSGRGVARLSFTQNFHNIVEVYKPTVLVVVESRISQKNLVQLMNKIDMQYDCGMFGSENFYGGVLIFWRTNAVQLFANTNYHKGCKADVTIKGNSGTKTRKCLFMEDVKGGKAIEPKI